MKIFKVVQRNYAILGISPSNRLTQTRPFNKRVFFGFSLFGCIAVSQFIYTFHVANGFMEYMECICSIFAGVIIFVCFAAIVFRQTTLFESIAKMEQLIQMRRRKYPQSKSFLSKTNRRVERVCEIVFMVILKVFLQLFILPKFIVSFGIYFFTDSGRDSFQLPYPFWFPFDATNPIGYLMAVIIEYTILGYEFIIDSCTLALGIGAFWFAIALTEEIQRTLHAINDQAQANERQSNESKILLSEFIYAHGIAKQLIHDFSELLQPIIMTLFTWSLLAISGVMFIIQVEILHHGNVMPVLLNATLNGVIALTAVLIACEIGHRMNDAFEGIDFTIDQWNWYMFPIETKRMLPMIIKGAQQPVTLECFGSITCGREVFKKIIKHAYSYFTVLSQLGD